MKLIIENFEDSSEDYLSELSSNTFWSNRTDPDATCGRIADILLEVQDYIIHQQGYKDNWFEEVFLPKATSSGVKSDAATPRGG